MTGRDRVFWLVAAVALADYLVMLAWSIPRISAEAGGMTIFDMRPSGYSFDEARTFLAALSPEGERFYTDVQHRLDAVYPALLAVTLGWAILRLAPTGWGVWRWPLAASAIPGMVFDYRENDDVARMLAAGPDGITPQMVEAASFHSQAKAVTTTVSMTILLVLLALWALRRMRGRPAG